jgi:hypothetical protein
MKLRQVAFGGGVRGIERQDALIDGNGLVEAVQLRQHESLVLQRLDQVRPQRGRAVEPLQSLGLPAKRLQRIAEIVAGVGIVRIERDRLLIDIKRFLEPPQTAQRKRAQLQRWNLVRLQFVAAVELRQRLFEPPQGMEQEKGLVGRVAIPRVEF